MTQAVVDLSDYQFATMATEGELLLCRGRTRDTSDETSVASRRSVLMLMPASDRPRSDSRRRIEHEHALRDALDGAWAVSPLALAEYESRTVLLREDPGGSPLSDLVGRPMELGQFLRLAIRLATIVGEQHACGIVHKDIKPANILVDAATEQVWLTGFGIATRLRRERQSPGAPEVIAGTLAYMAPEQTGRINRSIDARSDLYALGVTYYEMLIGQLPFTAADAMEWVHCHVARRPPAPRERRPDVPPTVSSLVMRLLAKMPEERFQTAHGLAHDLERCLFEWTRLGEVSDFELGAHDVPDRLMISEKLYGREHEIATLLGAFDRAATGGAPELVLVAGYSGIGKSSVVNELHKALVPARGLFASGKVDQYKRDIPYATLAHALQSLVSQLLAKSDVELGPWQAALQAALQPNGRLITDLVPGLELVIGEQPAVPELPPHDAQRRFHLVLRRFLSVFARPEHPLALFLDDLQWLDMPTLDLLESVMTENDLRHLLVIGAYRDNEVDATHSLSRKLETIKAAGAPVVEIALTPLEGEHVERLIADALRSDAAQVAPLARLVTERTGGNPFFAIQFLGSLSDEAMLFFDRGAARWSWDLERIRAKGFSDNVVDLMVGKLTRLPKATQRSLGQLACLGSAAPTPRLAQILEVDEAELHVALAEAVRLELVERTEVVYRFAHDRVQEAAYSLIPETMRAAAHVRIGRALAAHTPPDERETAVFDIVDQLNRGASLITATDERECLAELNLIAGKRAHASTAYASALTYFRAGSAALPSDGWEKRRALALALEYHRAECELLVGDLVSAHDRLSLLAARAKGLVEQALVACLRINVFMALDQRDRSVETGLEYLRSAGVMWSPHPTPEVVDREFDRLWEHLGDRAIEELITLPLMKDSNWRATMDVLTAMLPPALFTDENLFSLTVARMAAVSLEHGLTDGSCLAFVWLGLLLGPRFDNYRAAFAFGQLGFDLVHQRGLNRFRARVFLDFSHVVNPWMQHSGVGPALVRRAFDAAHEAGDLTFAGFCSCNLVSALLAAGEPLAAVQREAEALLAFVRKTRFGLIVDIITGQLRLILALRGTTPIFSSFDGPDFNEADFEQHLDNDPGMAVAIGWYWVRKLQGRFFAGDYRSAVAAASRVERVLWTMPSHLEVAEYHFYAGLARAALFDTEARDERVLLLNALRADRDQLETWARHCPANFECRAALVAAEIARLDGRDADAMRLYEQAIRSARVNDFAHHEAVAYETAARYYAARGFEQIADVYLRSARHCYLQWGAAGKARQLGDIHPDAHGSDASTHDRSTIGTPVDQLDLATVIDLSQAVSSDIVLETLVEKLLRTAVEHAGAERGVLMLPRRDEFSIHAEATTEGDAVVVRLGEAPVTATELPASVVQYAARTRESVVLEDACVTSPFSNDKYIRRTRARSVLCLPLVKQSTVVAVLYLENNLAAGVFTPKRLAVLKVLASQAAMSIENGRLYRQLEEREAKIRRLVDANVVGVLIAELDGRVLDANDAFLDMMQLTRDDLAHGGINWAALTPPEWEAASARAVEQLRSTGTADLFEKEYLRKDGSRVPVLVAAAAIAGTRTESVAFVVDLTERKRTEEALRRSEAYLAEAQRFTRIGTWAYDPATKTTKYWSDELYRIYAMSPHPGFPDGGEAFRRIHPDDRDAVRETILSGIHARADFSHEYRLLLPDGTIKHVLADWHPVFDGAGQVVEYVGTAADVTERKTVEVERERIRQLEAHLARLNRVTTLGELTGALAHEIKQPLAAAVMSADACVRWLQRAEPDLGEARVAASRVVGETKRAAEIIDRVRALYARREQTPVTVDVNDTVREMAVMLGHESNRRSVQIRTDLEDGLPPVIIDRVQLQQVLMNLLLNGIEAMRDAPGEVTVSSALTSEGEVMVSVCDAGVGLAPEDTDRIFEAFFTTKEHGSGMGLSISRRILEAHRGRLWVMANAERGATFRFTLPVTA